MSFILKIVEGPNRGAEIALVEGVAVTLGKGDECDIVLADSTLPEEPLSIEATADAVTVNGEQLEQFAVKTLGATSFAVGPADSPWGELKWPEKKELGGEAVRQLGGEETAQPPAEPTIQTPDHPTTEPPNHPTKRRHGCLGCLVVVVLLVLLLAALAWIFRAKNYYDMEDQKKVIVEANADRVQSAESLVTEARNLAGDFVDAEFTEVEE